MSQCKTVKGTKEKKKGKGWSTGEMKDKPSSSWEEDTEEMRTWRSSNPEEMDQCWKNLAERMEGGRNSGQVQGRGQQKRGSQRERLPAEMEACAKKQTKQDKKEGRRLLGKTFRLVQRIQPAASAKHA